MDYRRLNASTKKDVHPLPLIDDILDALNIQSSDGGIGEVKLDEELQQKLAYIGAYLSSPTCLSGYAPATFQRLMA